MPRLERKRPPVPHIPNSVINHDVPGIPSSFVPSRELVSPKLAASTIQLRRGYLNNPNQGNQEQQQPQQKPKEEPTERQQARDRFSEVYYNPTSTEPERKEAAKQYRDVVKKEIAEREEKKDEGKKDEGSR